MRKGGETKRSADEGEMEDEDEKQKQERKEGSEQDVRETEKEEDEEKKKDAVRRCLSCWRAEDTKMHHNTRTELQ